MKHTIKNQSDTKVQVKITVSAEELADIKQKTLARLASKVKVAGFRPGKVPAKVAEKNLEANYVNSEVLEDAINSAAVEAFDIEKITPLDQPKVDVQKYVPNEELEFTVNFETLPKIKLGDYKKLKAKKVVEKVDEKEVAEVIKNIQRSAAKKQVVERAAKIGDEVILDFEGKDKDGKEVPGATGRDYALELGSNSFIPGFEDGLVDKKAGDKFDLPLTFPKDYHHKPLAGAKVTFAVTIKEVKEVALPELNDEFAANAGPFKTYGELKEDVVRELTEQKEREANNRLKDELIEDLVKSSNVPTPEVLVADQMQGIERDFVQNLLYRGMTLEQYLEQQKTTKEEWLNGDLRKQAERRVQIGLVLAELSKAEKIEVTKDKLEERLQDMAKHYGNTPEVMAELDKPEVRRDLANRVVTEMTVDRLVELNTK